MEGDFSYASKEEMGIELGNGFTCDSDGNVERCCNKHWCYDTNGVAYGTHCVGSNSPVAIRIDNKTNNLFELDVDDAKYSLQYGTCPEAPHPNHIVCYDSEEYCKMFHGVNNSI